jgi:DNA end-binding protein Ku
MLGPEGRPLQRRYYCSADGQELGPDDIVRGYEWPDGSFTIVSDEELDALAPRKSRDIDLRRFVDRSEIPPKLLERPYLFAPAGESTKAYHLLAATMERSGRAGIATFVMRGKEYLAAIFAEGGLLRAATMRFVDELRTPRDVGLGAVTRVSAQRREAAVSALAKLHAPKLDRKDLEDEDVAALYALAERKHKAGLDVVEIEEAPADATDEGAEIIDIMSVLRQRLAGGPAPTPAADKSAGKAPAREHSAQRAGPARAGAPRADEGLASRSKQELYERAKQLDLPNRSRMSKDELIAALRARR